MHSFLVFVPDKVFFFVDDARDNWYPEVKIGIAALLTDNRRLHIYLDWYNTFFHIGHSPIFSSHMHRHSSIGGSIHEALLESYRQWVEIEYFCTGASSKR